MEHASDYYARGLGNYLRDKVDEVGRTCLQKTLDEVQTT